MVNRDRRDPIVLQNVRKQGKNSVMILQKVRKQGIRFWHK